MTAMFKDNKVYHYEGGWPKDINMKDLEQIVRYRRKIEKDELYIHTMLQLLPVYIYKLLFLLYKTLFNYILCIYMKRWFIQVNGALRIAKQCL